MYEIKARGTASQQSGVLGSLEELHNQRSAPLQLPTHVKNSYGETPLTLV